jgi:hypothetical protein
MERGSSLRIFYRLSPDNVNCSLQIIDISSDDLPEDSLEETKAISKAVNVRPSTCLTCLHEPLQVAECCFL